MARSIPSPPPPRAPAGDRLVTAERVASVSGRASRLLGKFAAAIDDARLVPDALARPFASAARTFEDFNEGMRPLASTTVKDAEQTSAWARIFAGGEDPAKIRRTTS